MFTHLRITGVHVLDHDEALAFYVGKLGLEVRADADFGFMRWVTVGVPGDPSREIMLEKPGAPSMDENTAEQARDLVTKGAGAGWLIFATDDIQLAHATLQANGVDLPDAPTEQSYGIDFGFRDPFGNQIRVSQMTSTSAH